MNSVKGRQQTGTLEASGYGPPFLRGLVLLGIVGAWSVGLFLSLRCSESLPVVQRRRLLSLSCLSSPVYGATLPTKLSLSQFATVYTTGFAPLLLWAPYQFFLFLTSGSAACAGGSIGSGLYASGGLVVGFCNPRSGISQRAGLTADSQPLQFDADKKKLQRLVPGIAMLVEHTPGQQHTVPRTQLIRLFTHRHLHIT
jgi:hypothetical protein